MKKSVYILEKSNAVSDLLKFLLEKRFGISVKTFDNELRFESALQNCPDLVIMDFTLGREGTTDLTGLQLIRNLKAKYADLPFILCSTQLNFQLALERLKCGATDYIDRSDDDFYEKILRSVRQTLRLPRDKSEMGWNRVKMAGSRLRTVLSSMGLS